MINDISLLNYTIKMDYKAGFSQLLRRRQRKSTKQKTQQNDQLFQSVLEPYKQITIDSIIEKILKYQSKSSNRCQLSLQEKYALIQHISNKLNISFNSNTLVELMTVWRYFGVKYFQQQSEKMRPTQHSESENISQQCLFNNFFVLYGQVTVFEKQQLSIQPTTFSTESQLQVSTIGQQPKTIIQQNTGWGPIFQKKQSNTTKGVIRVSNAIIIEVQAPELESALINFGGMGLERKAKIIELFPIFNSVSKKMTTILPVLQLRKYYKNQQIYKIKNIPQAVYLILKGQVMFQSKIDLPQNKQPQNSHIKPHTLQTQILGAGNYFGQQQIINKTNRALNAICRSVDCMLLEIPIDKFQKLLVSNSDFLQQVKICAELKIRKRKQKIKKSVQIYGQFNKTSEKYLTQQPEILTPRTDDKRIGRRRSMPPSQTMHGNIIKNIPPPKDNEPIHFSMLAVHPGIYQSTLKKYRRYSVKPPEKYKPEVNWDLQRVWKVLNLQAILREQSPIKYPAEGLHFYETHLRLQNQLLESKSLRPKTASSSHKAKLQYIAYLQQFNN